ncbi:MAG: hypothetical protein J6D26_03590 [Clostridia bacterium]|nr:hypothetical protein [Clostridia bacterium]
MKKLHSLSAKILILVFVLQCFSAFTVLGSEDYSVIVDDLTKDESIGTVTLGDGVTNAGPKSTSYNGTPIHANTGSASSTFKWTPNLQKDGSYKVYVWYDISDQRPTAVTYEINYAGGTDSKTINQKENGGQWVELGTYTFAAGTTGSVTASTNAKYTCFDAVKFEFLEEADVPVSPAGNANSVLLSVIVDNLAANNTDGSQINHTGTALTKNLSGKATAYLDTITSNVENGDSAFTWTPNLTVAGPYKVYVWYDTAPASRPSAVEYNIVHAKGSDKVTINQKENSSQWVELGTYDFAAGMAGSVTATAPAKYTCYDAVKFDYIGSALPSASAQAGAEPFSGIEDKDDREKLTLLGDLGILQGSYVSGFNPEGTMPAADFIKLMEVLGYISYDAALSTDTNPITYDNVIKAFIDVLWYKPDITHNNDYVTLASDIGLLDGVAYTKDTAATCMDIARIAYNALEIPILNRLTYGSPTIKFTTDTDKTLLSEVLDITKIDARLTGFGACSIDGREEILMQNELAVGGKVFKYDGISEYRLISNFGEKITAYVKSDKKSKIETVISIINDENESDVVVIDADDLIQMNAGSALIRYSYYEDGGKKKKNTSVSAQAQVIYNGRLIDVNEKSLTDTDVEYLCPESGNVKLILDSGKCTQIIVTSYETLFVKSLVKDDNVLAIYDHNYKERTLRTEPDDEECRLILLDSQYKRINPEKISKNAVISVAKSLDGESIVGIISTNAISGTIDAIENSKTATTIEIGGELYETDTTYDTEDYTVGQSGKFYLNVFGKISAVIDEPVANDSFGFGYIIGIDKEDGLSNAILVKMLSDDNTISIYTLANAVNVDGYRCKTPALAQERLLFNINYVNLSIPSLGESNKTQNLLQPIRYKLNSNKAIYFIDTPYIDDETGESDNSLQVIELAKNLSSANYLASQSLFFNDSHVGVFATSGNTKTFIVSKSDDADDKYFICMDSSYIKNGLELSNVSAYRVAEKGFEAEVLVVYTDDPSAYGTPINAKDDVLVINRISTALNTEGEQVLKVTGLKQGKEVSLLADSDTLLSQEGEPIVAGDIIRYVASNNGIYDAPVERIYSIKSENGIGSSNPANFWGDYGTVPLKAYTGYVYDIVGNYMQITTSDPQNGFDAADSQIVNMSAPQIMVYEIDSRTGTGVYRAGSVNDITDYQTSEDSYSKVLLLISDKVAKTLIIFKN